MLKHPTLVPVEEGFRPKCQPPYGVETKGWPCHTGYRIQQGKWSLALAHPALVDAVALVYDLT